MTRTNLTGVDHWSDQTASYSIIKRTLRGGLSDGVDILEVNNGTLTFTVLPTRGMNLWRGNYQGVRLGWDAPVRGPVHPKFVDLQDRGGIGWLQGFDEWLCRCGLSFNGPPGDDNGTRITLHGRISNLPAHFLEVAVDETAGRIEVTGEVEEGGLFYPRMCLRTTYTTDFHSQAITVVDRVTNLSARPAEMQMLYHINQGPPLLEGGSKVHVPIQSITPLTDWAESGLSEFDTYLPPTTGFAEQVYSIVPKSDAAGRSLAVLHDAAGKAGLAVEWATAALPYFTVWKNTAASQDGYVTGLEPATGWPLFKAKEREAGRVVTLPPGGVWRGELQLIALTNAEQVTAAVGRVRAVG